MLSILFMGCSTPLHKEPGAHEALVVSPTSDEDLDSWLMKRIPQLHSYLDANISPEIIGYKKGFVTAAPWVVKGVQDYRFHWVRDGALVMSVYVDQTTKAEIPKKLVEYVNFSRENQTSPEPKGALEVGLGEVKFDPDGSRFTNWARPQNDGPALRVITISRLAQKLIDSGKKPVARYLFDAGKGTASDRFQAPAILKTDLDYLAQHWRDASYDPWEEVSGEHFYTRLVQRKALLDGVRLARIFRVPQLAKSYEAQAKAIEETIDRHWIAAGKALPNGSSSPGQIWDTYARVAGIDYKTTGLDVSVVLGALHAHDELDLKTDRFYSPSSARVLQTAYLLDQAFRAEYPLSSVDINHLSLGTPIGRYPRDKYNGYDGRFSGNPWYLATAAYSELYDRCADEWEKSGRIDVDPVALGFFKTLDSSLKGGESFARGEAKFESLQKQLRTLADTYLKRIQTHEGVDGHLTEEFMRTDGRPTGAENLSWSYASLIKAASFRHR